jgi:hypothetical protein
MSMLKKLEKIAARPQNNTDGYEQGIHKIASEAIAAYVDYYEDDSSMSKQAEEAIEKLSAEDRAEIVNFVRYGQGMARGEYLGKQAGYRNGTMDMYDVAIKIAGEIYGPDKAIKLAAKIMDAAGVTEEDLQAEDEEEQVKADITEAAAQQLIEAAGGEENITPEQAEELMEVAETAGEIGLQQLAEGEDEDDPDQ